MGSSGLEPLGSSQWSPRSPSLPVLPCSLGFRLASSATGGASAPPLTLTALGRVSRPAASRFSISRRLKMALVGSSGLEPPTSRLSGVRSNQLSYEPISTARLDRFPPVKSPFLDFLLLPFLSSERKVVVEMNGFEPMTPCLQSRCSPS